MKSDHNIQCLVLKRPYAKEKQQNPKKSKTNAPDTTLTSDVDSDDFCVTDYLSIVDDGVDLNGQPSPLIEEIYIKEEIDSNFDHIDMDIEEPFVIQNPVLQQGTEIRNDISDSQPVLDSNRVLYTCLVCRKGKYNLEDYSSHTIGCNYPPILIDLPNED